MGYILTGFKYFQLKSWSDLQKKQWIDTHSGAYASYVFNTTLFSQLKIISNCHTGLVSLLLF